jgi:hypothetical protein
MVEKRFVPVVLRQDVAGLGSKVRRAVVVVPPCDAHRATSARCCPAPCVRRQGATVDVAAGYARNVLVPHGTAMYATPENVSRFGAAPAQEAAPAAAAAAVESPSGASGSAAAPAS